MTLADAELTWYTDGSIFTHDGKRYAEAAVVTQEDTIWATALPSGMSPQKAELIALIKALEMAKGKRLNVYTHSSYAVATVHVDGAIYQECKFRTAEGKLSKTNRRF